MASRYNHPANMFSDDVRFMMRRNWDRRARANAGIGLHHQDPNYSMEPADYADDQGASGYHDSKFD